MENLLEKLNPEQRLAAETTEGPVLILAGAGTGETRAVTVRMANLIAKGTPADAILAVTFTNKGAEEMQTRVSDLLLRAGVPPQARWGLTVHLLCCRVGRGEAVDLDDLLLRSARLLRDVPEVRDRWRKRFAYLHVDEYQDTNRVQYELLRMLTNEGQNVCVVGDEDQSIYRWRGADVSILLSFSQDFPAARVIRLGRNYRSTQKILDAGGPRRGANPSPRGANPPRTKQTRR